VRQATKVTNPVNSVSLGSDNAAETVYTVFNASGIPMRGEARLIVKEPVSQGWIKLDGEAEHDFPIADVHPYTVKINVPADASSARIGGGKRIKRHRMNSTSMRRTLSSLILLLFALGLSVERFKWKAKAPTDEL
jgi:hypothetical protein